MVICNHEGKAQSVALKSGQALLYHQFCSGFVCAYHSSFFKPRSMTGNFTYTLVIFYARNSK